VSEERNSVGGRRKIIATKNRAKKETACEPDINADLRRQKLIFCPNELPSKKRRKPNKSVFKETSEPPEDWTAPRTKLWSHSPREEGGDTKSTTRKHGSLVG